MNTIADLIPLTFWINGVRVRALQSFSVQNTLKQFLDTATVTLANPTNDLGLRHYSTSIRLGAILEIKWEDEVKFKGIVEDIASSRNSVSAKPSLQITARDVMVDVAETDVDPKPERTVTDNAVIKEIFGTAFEYQLEGAVTHKKFSMHSGETAEKAAERIAKLGGFMLWAEGNTIIKAKPATTGAPVVTLDVTKGHLMEYSISQSIKGCKSQLIGYSASGKNEKVKEQRTPDLTVLLRAATYVPTLSRTSRYTVDTGDQADTRSKMEEMEDSVLPEEVVEVAIADLQNIPLNRIVHVRIPEEAIDRDLVCVERRWTLDADGSRATELSLILPGRKTWR